MTNLVIPAGRTWEIQRIELRGLHGRHTLELPHGAIITRVAVQGQSLLLSVLGDPTRGFETRRLFFLPMAHGAKTPEVACALRLVSMFEVSVGAPEILVLELLDEPAAQPKAA
jgi:hypothetical protein